MAKKFQYIFVLVLVLVLGQEAFAQRLIRPYFINKTDKQMLDEANSAKQYFSHVTDAVTPAQYDLLKYQSPIKDQGQRGTCVAFASMALVESLIKAKTGQTVDLSEQYAYWQSKAVDQINPHSDGSDPLSFLTSIANHGVPMEQAWPYERIGWFADPTHPDCVAAFKANPEAIPVQCITNGNPPQQAQAAQKVAIINPHNVPSAAEAIMGFIQKGMSVEVGMDVYDAAWNFHNKTSSNFLTGTVLMPAAGDKIVGGHAVLIVGYDRVRQVFLFKNSWGTSTWASRAPVPGFGTVPFSYVRKFAGAVVASLPN